MAKLKIVVICGSVRAGSMTKQAVKVVIDELGRGACDVDLIDPTGFKLAALGEPFSQDLADSLRKRVSQADGLVLCTPEYNGCFSYVLMAVIENLGYPSALFGKTISILGVASGVIGAIKAIEHLRGVCAHLGAIVLPGAISIAQVHKYFGAEDALNDASIDKQIRSVPQELIGYLSKRIS